MPEEQIRKDVYNTIRSYNNRGIKLYNTFTIWNALNHKYTRREIGYALQQLKQKKAVGYIRTHNMGWVANQ